MCEQALYETVIEAQTLETGVLLEKKEAMEYLLYAAITAGIDPETLVLTEEYKDREGRIIKLEAKSENPQTGNYKLVTCQIDRAVSPRETDVGVTSWNKDSDFPLSGVIMLDSWKREIAEFQ